MIVVRDLHCCCHLLNGDIPHGPEYTLMKKITMEWLSVFHIVSWSRFADKVTHLNRIPTKQECTRDKSHNRACNKLEQNPDGATNSDIETPSNFVKLNVFGLFQRCTIKGFSDRRGGIQGLHTYKAEALICLLNALLRNPWISVWQSENW